MYEAKRHNQNNNILDYRLKVLKIEGSLSQINLDKTMNIAEWLTKFLIMI